MTCASLSKRRQLTEADAFGLTKAIVSTVSRQEVSGDLLEVEEYAITIRNMAIDR